MQKEFQSLVEMQEHSCKIHQNREMFGTKINGKYRFISYREFQDQVNKMRGALGHLGIKKGDRVGIIASNRVEWAVSSYATMGLGAQFVPMYETQSLEDIAYIVNDCSMKLLFISNRELLKKVLPAVQSINTLHKVVLIEGHQSGVDNYQDLLNLGTKYLCKPNYPTKEDLMGIIYTSGTTGIPKGVLLSHGNILSNVASCPKIIDINKNDRSLTFLPWAHIFGQMTEVHLLIYCGFSTGFAESTNTIIDNLAEIKPTILLAVPRIFNRIYDGIHAKMKEKPFPIRILFNQALSISKKKKSGQQLTLKEIGLLQLADKLIFRAIREKFGGRLRYAVSGASALNKEVGEFIDALNITVLEGYGLSETSPLVAVNTTKDKKIGTVGKVVPGVHVVIDKSVLGENITDCEEGEIIVYGPNVMQGYLNADAENRAVFTKDGGFKTGDLGRIDKEGFLHITGRIKEQYKLENGKYVVPNVIEEELKLSPYINNAFIYGTNKTHNVAVLGVNMAEVKKFIKTKKIRPPKDNLLEEPKIQELFQNELEKFENKFKSYERPRNFALVEEDWTPDNGLLTPSLKLKRRVVYGKYRDVIENLYTPQA